MEPAAWKRIKRKPAFLLTKRFLERLQGRELRLRPEIAVTAVKSCGWWYQPSSLGERSIVYAIGIGGDLSFETRLIDEFGPTIHAFDPTPSTVELIANRTQPESFNFHPWAIDAEDGTMRFFPRAGRDGSASTVMYTTVANAGVESVGIDVPVYTLESAARKLGHERVDLLKMDIEGAEYVVLNGLLRSSFRPTQLLVEFHDRFPGIGKAKTAGMIDRLHDAGYRIFVVGETGREIGFLHSNDSEAQAARTGS